VIHAAAVLDDRQMRNLDPAIFMRVFRVQGAGRPGISIARWRRTA